MSETTWIEADIIGFMRSATKDSPCALGLLDDCAIIPKDQESVWLISQDSCVEDVHFLTKYFSPKEIAHKTFHTTISDIAAMGGKPEFITLAISLPLGLKTDWVKELVDGFIGCAEEFNVKIIGGDTTRSPGPLFLSATVIGAVAQKNLKKRSSAIAGNLIAICGNFGYASMGFEMLRDEALAKKYPQFIAAQKMPTALIEQGLILGRCSEVTAMMDVSDGILRDVENLCRASNLQAHIDLKKIPVDEAIKKGAQDLGLNALNLVLASGEDYGLLVALDHQAPLSSLNTLIEKVHLRVIGHLSRGNPAIVFENAPDTFIEDPPLVFEHGQKT